MFRTCKRRVLSALLAAAVGLLVLGTDRLRDVQAAGAERGSAVQLQAVQPQAVQSPAAQSQAGQTHDVTTGMVLIPEGSFVPLFSPGIRKDGSPPAAVTVSKFWLDATPVTNAQFLAFVRVHPNWKRSQIKRVFAEQGYLSHWANDEAWADAEDAGRPITHVSWFAARSYCAAQGKTLPTTMQWEYAAAASATQPAGEYDPAFTKLILEWYSRPNSEKLAPVGRGLRNVWGVYDLHGLVWEWTSDFNTALVTGESRADSALERSLFCGAAAATATSFRDYAAFMRYGYRASLSANYTVANLGFRCASAAA